MNRAFVALMAFTAFFLVGCAHTISYKMTDADRLNGKQITGVLCVQPFLDNTFSDHAIAITNKVGYTTNDTWRLNYRKKYNSTNLSAEVTGMIMKQISYSGLFTNVVLGTATNADWYLSGTLAQFIAMGQVNEDAEEREAVLAGLGAGTGGAIGGALGVIIGNATTAHMKSIIKTIVKLDELKVSDRTGKVYWRDSITISNCVTASFHDANAGYIFNYPDWALKEAVTKMIVHMESSALTNHLAEISH
jgi:ABC-type lipoprotein release transport system permease subunit